MEIHDLFKDLADGKMLMKLLEIISGENLGKPNKGILRVQKAENINRCLTFLRTKVLVFIQPKGRIMLYPFRQSICKQFLVCATAEVSVRIILKLSRINLYDV